jgi:hypothetical protein
MSCGDQPCEAEGGLVADQHLGRPVQQRDDGHAARPLHELSAGSQNEDKKVA